MPRGDQVSFGEFRLDLRDERLWRGPEERVLRGKSFAVLRHLVLHRGRLVTKQELFGVAWAGTAVSETVLRVCVREIRVALGDDPLQPRFLQTVARRGYRFADDGMGASTEPDEFVGRTRELAVLEAALRRVASGRRRVVFVAGDAGIGKTALVDRFVERARARSDARVAVGQCVELTTSSEPYLPLLDLLGRLATEDSAGEVLAALDRWAPTWLLHLPGLVGERELDGLRRRVPAPNRDRMLRELGDLIEVLGRQRPVVLVLEDLHWSDASSVDALAFVAQRSAPARVLLLGTVRPVELILARHALKPLKQSLVARGIASELVLDALTEAEVADYLASRLGGHPVDPALPPALHRRTAGNPLFLGAVLGALRAQGALDPADGTWRLSRGLEGLVPESVRQLVARQLGDGAPLEREVLEAASVMGVDFAVAPVAAAAGQSPEVVEEVCARLAQEGRLLAASGVAAWPDGTVSGRYEFLHALYREGVLQRLSPARARQLHGAVGACIEAGHAGREADVAAVLAAHFAEGGEPERARHYHALAADGARGRHADREVILHLDAALTLLQGEPETPERALTELTFHLQLGAANFAVRGYASAEARAHYARARDLAERVEAPASYMEATAGLYTGHAMGGELRQARALAEDLVALAARTPAALFTVVAHTTHGSACFNLGDFPAARASFTRVDEVWSPELPRLVIDQTVLYRSMQALVLLHLGEETAGAEWSRRALAYAADLDDPFNRAWAHSLAAQYAATAGNRDVAREHAEIAVTLASEHGFPVHHASASVPLGWALRDPARIAAGMEAYAGVGQRVARSFQLALLAEVCLEAGDVAAARAALEEALRFAADTGEARHLAELHRLRAECQWRQGAGAGEVEGELRHAAAIGCQQGAGLWERRAAASLARFLDGQKRTARRARRPATS